MKHVGGGVNAILMEMDDVEYQCRQDVKDILRDLRFSDIGIQKNEMRPVGTHLQWYVEQKHKAKLSQMTLIELSKLFFKKLLRI